MPPRPEPCVQCTAYTLAHFDYDLPTDLIARRHRIAAAADCCTSRRTAWKISASPALRRSLLVFNDTRVIKARIRGRKPTGGEVENLVERITGPETALVHLKASHPPRVGGTIDLESGARAKVEARRGRLFALRFDKAGEIERWLECHEEVPRPPYITHVPAASDAERYQTV